jgi:hypothetical protein
MLSLTQKEVSLVPEKSDCIKFFAGMIQDYIEGMFIVLSTVNDFSDKSVISRKDFIVDVRKKGIKLYHLGEIECSESLSMVNYNNSIDRLHEEGITTVKIDGKNQEVYINTGESFKEIMGIVSGYLSLVKNG